MRLLANPSRRPRRLLGLALVLTMLASVTASAATLPPGPTTSVPAPSPVDPYTAYDAQKTCDPTIKPGALELLTMARSYYGIGRNLGISRACNSGGTSEHKEGRAFDWGLNVSNPAEKAAGDQFTNWLIAPGPDDQPGYNARRLGVMYIIWNRQIWSAGNAAAGWRPYTGASPHTDHVHVSLGWNGAYQRTSWWTGNLVAQRPIGAIDSLTTTRSDLTVRGWALDPDTSRSIDVHVYVDGVGTPVRADTPRQDVADAYGRGANHGFGVTIPATPGQHSVCVYAIDSDPIGNSGLGCRTVVVRDAVPVGGLESVTATRSSITFAGWALDPDTTASTDVHVYVDGAGVAVRANQPRADIGRGFGKGDLHGFTHTARVQPGRHEYCVYAINDGPGAHTPLGCGTITAADPPTAAPVGALESVTATATTVEASGWTVDPDTTNPTDVHVYVDGVSVAVRADLPRADIARAFGKGDRHGFSHTARVAPGRHEVCAYAINTGPGAHTPLGCRTVVAQAPPTAAPIGSLDAVTASRTGVTASGWTVDPDGNDPTDVHVYVDGRGVAVRADQPRADVASALGRGDRHGFTYTAPLPPGRHSVCVYAINTGPGAHTPLGCRDVTVVADRAPIGTVEAVVATPGGLTVSGWVLDPDTAEPTQAHVYVDGVGAAVQADLPRADIAAAYRMGDRHGFTHARAVSPGAHQVCVYGIDATGGDHRLLGCRTVQVS